MENKDNKKNEKLIIAIELIVQIAIRIIKKQKESVKRF
jgi:hypothetical protein